MKYLLFTILLFSSVLLTFSGSSHASPTPEEVVKLADESRYPSGQFSFAVRVTDNDNGEGKKETLYQVHTKGSNQSLVETKSPERLRGRKLLMKKQELWMFLPTLKKPTRVGFEQRLTGEVSNGDLARTNFADDYKPRFLADDIINQKPCYKLLLTATNKDVAYRKIVYWVEKKSFFPIQVNFYAISGKLLKTGKYSEIKLVLDKKRVTQLIIQDALQEKKQSRLNYFNFVKTSYDDSFFSKESLSD